MMGVIMEDEDVDFLDVRLTLTGGGRTHLAERGEPTNTGGFSTVNLLDVENDVGEVEMSVRADEDTAINNKLEIEISSYHVENPETKKAFHSLARMDLSMVQVERLKCFLEFVLAARRSK